MVVSPCTSTTSGSTVPDDCVAEHEFTTIKPGAYPWGNHHKAWRPAHIHFSLFGNVYAQRLVTQMYFPSDPLFDYDPIFQSIPDLAARQRLVSRFSLEETVSDQMLGYEFDIVLRGRDAAGALQYRLAAFAAQLVGKPCQSVRHLNPHRSYVCSHATIPARWNSKSRGPIRTAACYRPCCVSGSVWSAAAMGRVPPARFRAALGWRRRGIPCG